MVSKARVPSRFGLILAVMALLLVAGGVLGWLGVLPLGSSDDVAVRLRPDDAELVELGANVYRQQCAACHGRDLEGQPNWRQRGADGLLPAPPHDESGHTWHHPDRVLFEITKYGVQRFAGAGYRSAMPAYEGTLRDREIVAVLSFIKSRWSTEVQEKQAAMRAR